MNGRAGTICVALLLSMVASVRAEAPDLSTPASAVRAFLVAQATFDPAAMKACTFNIGPTYIDTLADAARTIYEVDQASCARFGPTRVGGPMPKSLEALKADANTNAAAYERLLQINGDNASLAPPGAKKVLNLKFVDEQWKIDGTFLLPDVPPEQLKREMIKIRVGTGIWAQLKQEIPQGKYFDWGSAQAAARKRIAVALAADPEYQAAQKAEAAAQAAPAPQPAQPGADAAADLSTPNGALRAYIISEETGDAAALKACTYNIDPEFIDLYCANLASVRDISELAATKFAGSAKPRPEHPKSVEALRAQANQDYQEFAKLPMRVIGYIAAVSVPRTGGIKIQRIDGQWKVNGDALFKDTSAENKRRDLLIYRITMKVREPLKQEITDGKFKDWPAVEEAIKTRFAAAIAADAEYQQADKALTDARNSKIAALRDKIAEHRANAANAGNAANAANAASAGNAAASQDGSVADPSLGHTAMFGGKGGGEFSQPSPDGSPVFGFHYSFGNWNKHQVLGQFDAIFEPAAGKPAADAPNVKTILARNGYVVGGLTVDYDDINAFAVRVIFVGFKDGRVDAKNMYTSNWIGTPLRIHQQQLAGAGEKVIGIFGRKGANTDALGLLLETNVKKTAKLGGDGGSPFSLSSPTGSPVIGFRYAPGDWGGRKILSTLDPVFRDSGPAQPDGFPAADLKLLTARDGYVVKSLLVDTDNTAAVAVKARFVRVKNGVVDEHDSYDSDWIGIPSGIRQQELAGGPGEVVVGTYGQKGINLDALGLLVSPLPAAEPASRSRTIQPAR